MFGSPAGVGVRACRSKGAVIVHRGALNSDSGGAARLRAGHSLHACGLYGLISLYRQGQVLQRVFVDQNYVQTLRSESSPHRP